MQHSCPVSFQQIDGTIARINAFFITVFVVLFLLTNQALILLVLIYDFAVRLFVSNKLSLVFHLSSMCKRLFALHTNKTDGAPKRVAAFFGLFFISLMLILHVANFEFALYVTAAVLLFCSTLEVTINYCLGCEIYHIYNKIFNKGTHL